MRLFPLLFAIPPALTLSIACGDPSSSGTTGHEITLRSEIRSKEPVGSFVTTSGWTVTLTRAILATGGFTYYDGAVILSKAPVPRAGVFGIRTAFAHPGHYIPGDAHGELLISAAVDLLGGASLLGESRGVSGFLRSATFRFASVSGGPWSAELGAHVALLEGAAEKGSDSRSFRASVDASEVLDPESAPSVEGCPFAEVDALADGIVTVTVDPAVWFDQVEFDTLPPGDRIEMPAETIARKELTRGMKVGRAYAFSYRPL